MLPLRDAVLPIAQTLNEFQQAVIDQGFGMRNHLIVQSPTGSGKSYLSKMWIASVLANGKRVVYLVPIRALAQELYSRLAEDFSAFKVGVFTGDSNPNGQTPFGAAQLLIMTPEKLDACTRAWRAHFSWISAVDLIICDEFHTLGDRHRGGRLEGALLRFRRLNPFARIVGLSATLGNLDELGKWIGGDVFRSNWRPIPLTWSIRRFKKPGDKPELLLQEVSRTIGEGGRCIVFVQSRRRSEALSKFLNDHQVHARHHHAGLLHADRVGVEDGFRSGEIMAIVATTTLAMGLNLPARKVILYDLNRFNGRSNEPIDVITAWQLAGRAGRPGLDAYGEAVLFASSQTRDAEQYLSGLFEGTRSSLSDVRCFSEQVLAEVASGLSRTEDQLVRAFSRSLAAFQHDLPDVSKIVQEMLDAGMLQYRDPNPDQVENMDADVKSPQLQATRLGHIASQHFLFPSTVLLFNRLAKVGDDLTFFDILLAAACSDDCEVVLPASFEELDGLSQLLEKEPSYILGLPKHQILDLLGVSGGRMLNGIKTALAARAWTRLSEIEEVADKFDCYPFEIFRLSESFERLLPAMAAVADPKDPGFDAIDLDTDFDIPFKERVQAATRMVHYGLDEYAATLALIDGIGSVYASRLKSLGIGDIEDLALCAPEDLAEIEHLSADRAAKWIAEAEGEIKRYSARRYVETGKINKILAGASWPVDVDPYRLRRAIDLHVVSLDGQFVVSGGSEARHVALSEGKWVCDCPDFIKGNQCKHILAVRGQQDDEEIVSLWHAVTNNDQHHFSLFELWFDPGKVVTAGSDKSFFKRPSQAETRSAASHIGELLLSGPKSTDEIYRAFKEAPLLTPLAERVNDAIFYLSGLQIIDRDDDRLALTAWGMTVKESGIPFHVAGGIRQLISDLMTVDLSFDLIKRWTPFDTLILLDVLNDSSPSLRMFSQELFEIANHSVAALSVEPVFWQWVKGDKGESKVEELMGSLGLRPEGKKNELAEWARKQAYQSVYNSLVMARLLSGETEDEIAASWKAKNLEAVAAGWRHSIAWLARGVTRLIASPHFFMDDPVFAIEPAAYRLRELAAHTETLIEALKRRNLTNE